MRKKEVIQAIDDGHLLIRIFYPRVTDAKCLDLKSPNWSYHTASRGIALEAIKKTRKSLDR